MKSDGSAYDALLAMVVVLLLPVGLPVDADVVVGVLRISSLFQTLLVLGCSGSTTDKVLSVYLIVGSRNSLATASRRHLENPP